MATEILESPKTGAKGVNMFSAAADRVKEEQLLPDERKLKMGPLSVVHAFWLAGMSCDGCSVSAVGATAPPVEDLLLGVIPGVPKVVLHHPVLSVEAGHHFVRNFEMAENNELGAPYVIIFEGSVPDERIAAKDGGYFAALGARRINDHESRPIATAEWLSRLAPGAAAVIAIGTCATWGGIPSATGNPTGSMSCMDFLGKDYRSSYGLPVINVPGCPPVGDNFTETVACVLLFLQGLGPLPEFDDLGRPAWLFNDTVHTKCVRGGYYEEGRFAKNYGDRECLVEVGCWGPVVQCNITSRGFINHVGGCMNTGGICIGCTMPSFPDGFTPFYKKPPGANISSAGSKVLGTFMRPLRRMTMKHQNREARWTDERHIPSGWGHGDKPGVISQFVHQMYVRYQGLGSKRKWRPK